MVVTEAQKNGSTVSATAPQESIAPKKIEPNWVFVDKGIKWEALDKSSSNSVSTAVARIVVFYPTGEFAHVGCILYQRKGAGISFSNGDDFTVSKGKWSFKDDRTILVSSRPTYGTMPQGSTPETTESVWKLRNASPGRIAGAIESPPYTYVPIMDIKNFEALSGMLENEYRDK